MGRGDGTFAQKTTGLPAQIRSLEQRFLTSLFVDIDQDGHPDLVLGSQPANGYVDNVILFNDGTGDFTTRPQGILPAGPLPSDNSLTQDIVSLDINQDGRPDLMLLSSAGVTDNGIGLQALINHGDGTLVDETKSRLPGTTSRLTGPWYPFIHFADFNGDGWQDFYLDIIQHEDGSIHPRVWLNNGDNTWTSVAPSALPPEFDHAVLHAVDFEGDGRPDILQLGGTLLPAPPDIGYRSFLNRTPLLLPDKPALVFSAVSSGAAFTARTPAQTVRLRQAGATTVAWTATSNKPWLTVSPASGSGVAVLSVGVAFDSSVAAAGTAAGTITLALTGAGTSVGAVNVTLAVVSSATAASLPFGVFDTPAGNATPLAGSIAVTGWALDNVGVQRVELWRDLQPGETTPPFASTPTDPRNGKVFISNATFVDNARPDVEALNPNVPFKYRAGWGYLLLTWGLWNQGNGTYKLHAFAFDQENNVATIGTKTIVVSNTAAAKPFGSIDTPGIGAEASGPNFGWALTPKVNGVATCKIQSTGAQVSIDSGPLQPVVYGDLRSDIAGAFPGFSNSAGAGGNYLYDWSTLANGTHTIGWFVTDDCNRADGIGSRFFQVSTGMNQMVAPEFRLKAETTRRNDLPESDAPITVAHGYGELPVVVASGEAGSRTVEVTQKGRVEIRVPRGFETAYQLGTDGQRRALPTGATWDATSGTLSWQPAPGFLGRYRIVFSNGHERIMVRIVVTP